MDDFSKQKIVWAETAQELKFSIVEGTYMTDKTTFILITNYDKYLTGLCNSKIIEYYVRKTASLLGNKGISCSKIFMEQIPAILPNKIDKNLFEHINLMIQEIISAHKQFLDCTYKTQELDYIFYNLYHLSKEEIAFINLYLAQFQ